MDVDELLHRIDDEQDRLLNLRGEVYDKYSELRSGQSDIRGELNVGIQRLQNVEFRVSALESNFNALRGRLWALIFIVLSEIVVAVLHFLMGGPLF